MTSLTSIRLLVIGILAVFTLPTYAAEQFTPDQKTQIETIVHDYVLKNPKLILAAIEKLQAQEGKKSQQQMQETISKHTKEIFSAPNSPILGNANGNLSVIVFSDYQCSYCKRISPMIDSIIKTNKNLRVVFKELPVFGETSQFAARAALAAQQQGKYINLHEALMRAKGRLSNEQIIALAKSAGLDLAKLKTAMNSNAVIDEVKQNIMLADALRISGTPAFIVAKTPSANTKEGDIILIPGAIDQQSLQKILNQLDKG